jgi:hypothetical protein
MWEILFIGGLTLALTVLVIVLVFAVTGGSSKIKK